MSLSDILLKNKKGEIMGLLTTKRGVKFIIRPDETGDHEWLGWEIDSDYSRGQTHKWDKIPRGEIEWFNVDDPPETVSYQPIIN